MKTYKMNCENINLKKMIISQHDHFSFSSQNHSWKSHCPMGYFISNSEIKQHWSQVNTPEESSKLYSRSPVPSAARFLTGALTFHLYWLPVHFRISFSQPFCAFLLSWSLIAVHLCQSPDVYRPTDLGCSLIQALKQRPHCLFDVSLYI